MRALWGPVQHPANTPVNLTFAGAITRTTTTGFVGEGAGVRAGSVNVAADAGNDVIVAASNLNNGISGLGIAVAYSSLENNCTAYIAGDVASAGDLTVAATLRAAPRDAFWTVAVPLARPGFLTGAVLGFAHTVGEFGVVLMIGGNIPGETKVLSVAIYDYVETLRWTEAHILSAGMLVFAFGVILSMTLIEKRVGRPTA